jgi:Fe-S-cluster containining protein
MTCFPCPHAQACCRKFKVPVTVEEDVSGHFRISQDRTFIVHLEREPDGSCVYLGQHGRCSIYESRPETCREYSCVGDARVEGS